jgi:hypothetical protein
MSQLYEIRGVTEAQSPCQCGTVPSASHVLVEIDQQFILDPERGTVCQQEVLRRAYFCDRCVKVVRIMIRDGEREQAFSYAG